VASDLTSLFNLALSAVGTRSLTSDPNENSREAEICRLWFPQTRDQVLRAAPWAAARSTARLPILGEQTSDTWGTGSPVPGSRFAYGIPADFLYPRFIYGYARFEMGTYAPTVAATPQPALFTDVEAPLLTYTSRQTNIALWDHGLFMAIAYGLAANIAMPLHGKPQRAKEALMQANETIMQARVQTANEDFVSLDHIPDWLAARGISSPSLVTRYIYPVGPMLAVANVQ
jgi:hypothetical protein